MRLLTLPGVFRPRSDSWMLATALAERVQPGQSVLDPFTGSGILAIAAARGGAQATAVDISRRAVACARINAALNGVRLRAMRAADLGGLGSARYDVIAANPPYVPSGESSPRGAARAWEAGPDGRRFIDRLCAQAPGRLRPGGRLLLVHSSICGERETLDRLSERGLAPRVIQRERGPLGPLMAAAAKAQGISPGAGIDCEEEVLVFEAVAV